TDLDPDALLFHAGTAINDEGVLVSSGGRVLNVIGRGKSLREAIEHTYRNVKKVAFEKSFYRRDIGKKGLLHTSDSS
ncbi:MAG: phosphoribosylglycinamide synthetase C domain-containing protein, partial [Balneolaceae bacterium]